MDFTYTKNVLLRLLTELLSDYTAEEIKEEIEFELDKIKTLEKQQQVSVEPEVKLANGVEILSGRLAYEQLDEVKIRRMNEVIEFMKEFKNKNGETYLEALQSRLSV